MAEMIISIAIPTHDDRLAWYGETINNLHDCLEVSEIIIVDDCSDDIGIFARMTGLMPIYNKIRVSRNAVREGAFRNKFYAVSQCKERYVALLDSDNIFNKDYLTSFSLSGIKHTLNCPVKAKPYFDYTELQNNVFTKHNVTPFASQRLFQMMINTGNYIVEKDKYIRALQPLFDANIKAPQCSDVAWAAYHILNTGYSIGFVPGMQYEHLDHPDSTYRKYKNLEPNATRDCLELIRGLS
jgi:glycosyltransferase involved in cell wall biosynthesis